MKKWQFAIILVLAVVVVLIYQLLPALIAIPNLSGVQNQAQINGDIHTAQEIGTSISIYEVENPGNIVSGNVIEYNKIENLDKYVNLDYTASSLKDGKYYVIKEDGIVKVAIAKNVEAVNELGADDIYNGTGAGWAYIEGSY